MTKKKNTITGLDTEGQQILIRAAELQALMGAASDKTLQLLREQGVLEDIIATIQARLKDKKKRG